MIVRVRCKLGNFRFELEPSDDLQQLVEKLLQEAPDAQPESLTFSLQPRGGEQPVYGHKGSLQQFGLSHGDLIFAAWQDKQTNGFTDHAQASTSEQPSVTSSQAETKAKDAWRHVKEDPVDELLERTDGKIYRKRDTKLCRHLDKAMCDYCMPLEPYDEKYQLEHKIKHLSFHSYLRKLDSAANKPAVANVSYLPPLEELDYKVTVPCSSGTHPSWPAGICSKCQPSAITLQLQPYRMVDHVEYSNPQIIEQFIDFWRRQGATQRFGYLIGHYEAYDQVPLGVKAVVEAIHEPPQQGDTDGIEVSMQWPDLSKVENLAAECGLRVVGMIYTDLVPDPDSAGKVICKRHADSFFLSSLETIFSARMQHARNNPSRFCMSGKFSSKFVTCVVTGNESGEIEVKAYQASDQAMALVDADLVEASVNPGIVRVKKEDDPEQQQAAGYIKRYVPDVFYKYKNAYNIPVQESAKPCFPVDYLLVSLTHGFPDQAAPVFASHKFAIENRQGFQDQSQQSVLSEVARLAQNLPSSISAIEKGKGKSKASDVDALQAIALWLSDWHLLSFLYMDFVGNLISAEDFQLFEKVALSARLTEADRAEAVYRLVHSSGWQTLAAIASESAPAATFQPSEASKATAMDMDDFPQGLDMDYDELLQARKVQEEMEQRNSRSASGQSTPAVPAQAVSVPPANAGVIVCPHCTFENESASTDCAICGLPLAS